MVDEQCALAVRSGMLVAALASTGLDPADVAGAVAAPEALGFEATTREAEPPPRPELHVVPDPEADRKAVEAAEKALAAAQSALDDATEEHDQATAAYDDLEARSLQLQAEIGELRGRIAELESTAEEVDDELSEAEDSRDEAEAGVRDATKARDAAAAALEKLGG
jgi:septal ring factor EnvC (AmiA/AmiB activator)